MSKRPGSPIHSEPEKSTKTVPAEDDEESHETPNTEALGEYANVATEGDIRTLIEKSDAEAAIDGTYKILLMRRSIYVWFKTPGANLDKVIVSSDSPV